MVGRMNWKMQVPSGCKDVSTPETGRAFALSAETMGISQKDLKETIEDRFEYYKERRTKEAIAGSNVWWDLFEDWTGNGYSFVVDQNDIDMLYNNYRLTRKGESNNHPYRLLLTDSFCDGGLDPRYRSIWSWRRELLRTKSAGIFALDQSPRDALTELAEGHTLWFRQVEPNPYNFELLMSNTFFTIYNWFHGTHHSEWMDLAIKTDHNVMKIYKYAARAYYDKIVSDTRRGHGL